jgi:alpha-D-ribose 1-methylphosphonate 5-triphosphate synthase subunit PhnG
VILTISAEPESCLSPAASADAELLVAVMRGACTIGGERYDRGDIRVQRAGAELPTITAGSHGANVVLMLSDRRAPLRAVRDERWQARLEQLLEAAGARPTASAMPA